MRRAVKDILQPYNRRQDYEFRLAHYMFTAKCKAQGLPQLNQFLAIVASTDWAACYTPVTSAGGAT
jgi:hypothetical protein